MITDRLDWLPSLLQTGDPLFPTGAYAHSLGLEEIVRLGIVRDEAGLLFFLKNQIMPAQSHLELPLLRFAYEAATVGNLETLRDIDHEISALKICRELREASIQLGVRRLQILLKIFPGDLLQRFEKMRLDGGVGGHHLVVFAMQTAGQNVPLDAALMSYLYQSLASSCSAALKLIRIGQEGCQRVLKECLDAAGGCVRASLEIPREEVGWFDPMLEIAAMRHEVANERMFIS